MFILVFVAAKVFYSLQFGAKLARAQSMSARSQPQTQASAPHPQNIFKRVSHTAAFVKTPQCILLITPLPLFFCLQKLQFIQDEKNKEIEALRQRVKELEQQSLYGLMDPRLKRRKNWDLLRSVYCNVRANFMHLFDSYIYV